jgi:hypothetical protein
LKDNDGFDDMNAAFISKLSFCWYCPQGVVDPGLKKKERKKERQSRTNG